MHFDRRGLFCSRFGLDRLAANVQSRASTALVNSLSLQRPCSSCRRFNARANNRGWRLDHFLVSQALHPRVHECYLLPQVMGSDHCPLGLVLKLD